MKPLQENIRIESYKIDGWVYGALQYFNLPFVVETKGTTGHWKRTITKIGEFANGPEGGWVYYVNDIKSKYHMEWLRKDDSHFQVVFRTCAWKDGQRYTVEEPLIITKDGKPLWR